MLVYKNNLALITDIIILSNMILFFATTSNIDST